MNNLSTAHNLRTETAAALEAVAAKNKAGEDEAAMAAAELLLLNGGQSNGMVRGWLAAWLAGCIPAVNGLYL